MSKRTILLAMTALFLLIGLSQSVMAKKVVYLGHQYKGKVNKEDVPEVYLMEALSPMRHMKLHG